MQLNVQQVDSYSKSVDDKAWMTIAIVEQQHNQLNAGLGLRIMPSGAEDNTNDTTFLQSTPESFLTEWPKRRFFVWASVKELLCAMITLRAKISGAMFDRVIPECAL